MARFEDSEQVGPDDRRMDKSIHPDGPSPEYLRLVGTPSREMAGIMRRGEAPDVQAISGWEWRGTNLPAASARLLGIRRFIKGFHAVDDRFAGYNVSVAGSVLESPWLERRQRDGRREWARFAVAAVDAITIDSRHSDALLLDYGAVDAPEPGLARRLRDFVVRVSPGSDEILLGHAFITVGSRTLAVGWFVLERLQPIAGD
ncbi:hypothetical protein GCM10027053_42860 [Intrasporangium mesophilum]